MFADRGLVLGDGSTESHGPLRSRSCGPWDHRDPDAMPWSPGGNVAQSFSHAASAHTIVCSHVQVRGGWAPPMQPDHAMRLRELRLDPKLWLEHMLARIRGSLWLAPTISVIVALIVSFSLVAIEKQLARSW